MSQPVTPIASPGQHRVRAGIFRRGTAWLFSQKHFHFKLLSGTAAGVVVIILDGYSFVLLAYRRCAAPLRGTSEFPGGDPFSATPWGIPAGTFGNERVEVFDSRVEPRSGGRQIVPWRGIQMNQFI